MRGIEFRREPECAIAVGEHQVQRKTGTAVTLVAAPQRSETATLGTRALADFRETAGLDAVLVLNKIDGMKRTDLLPLVERFRTENIFEDIFLVSALKGEGVADVVHLKGGILAYLEQIPEGDSRWQGSCFVFDERVSVGHGLVEVGDKGYLIKIIEGRIVSATPGQWELQRTHGVYADQVIRPTGLIDPVVEVRPVEKQVDDLLAEAKERARRKERVLVTTLTKRLSEDLTQFLREAADFTRAPVNTIDRLEQL